MRRDVGCLCVRAFRLGLSTFGLFLKSSVGGFSHDFEHFELSGGQTNRI